MHILGFAVRLITQLFKNYSTTLKKEKEKKEDNYIYEILK